MPVTTIDPTPVAGSTTLVSSEWNMLATRLYTPGGDTVTDAAYVAAIAADDHHSVTIQSGNHALATVHFAGALKQGVAKKYGTIEFVGKGKMPIEEWLRARKGDEVEVTIEREDYVWAKTTYGGAHVSTAAHRDCGIVLMVDCFVADQSKCGGGQVLSNARRQEWRQDDADAPIL
jgi:hypothetical protein